MRKYSNYFLFLILLIDSINCFALTQNEKSWLGINSTRKLNDCWTTFIFVQTRAINKSHPWQTGLLEIGAGYHFLKHQSLWVGYRWSGHHPFNGFYQENRAFQQLISDIGPTASNKIILRFRAEEIERGNSSQISVRLRQRLALLMKKELIKNIKLFLYDEIFFQLRNTSYTTNKLISENRIFFGFNWYISDKTWWEIGYINQYQMKTGNESQNTMSHVASFTYNLA